MKELLPRFLQGTSTGDDRRLWDQFINRPARDPANAVVETLLRAPEGRPFPVKTAVHDPVAMSGHLREVARFYGADLLAVAAVDREPLASAVREILPEGLVQEAGCYSWAVLCTLRAPYDPASARGIGGQFVVQQAAIVSFILAGYIREMGYGAVRAGSAPQALLAAAGLGQVAKESRGRAPYTVVTNPVVTDIPLIARTIGSDE